MANLTGDHDVATELSVGLVNAVVAVIHENEDPAHHTLPHSFTLAVADVPRGAGDPVPPSQRTGVTGTAEIQVSTPTVSLPLDSILPPILSKARAAVRGATGPVRESVPAPDAAIGTLEPLGPFGPGRRSCWPLVSARLNIRAWLRNGPDDLPEFLHGDLHLTTGLIRTNVLGVGTVLGLDHVNGPRVAFAPATGTTVTPEQRGVIEQIIRNFIRSESEPVTFKVDLPPDVRRFDLRLEAQGRQSVMIRLNLTDRPPPQGAGDRGSRFLPAGADFAVGIGRDFLLAMFRRELLRGLPAEFTASGFGYFVRIRPDWNGATFDLDPGRMVFTLSGSGSIKYGFGWFSTTDEWSFKIRQSITLGVSGGRLRPALAGDPEIELSDVAVGSDFIRSKARENIKRELNNQLNSAPPAVRAALDVGRPLREMLEALSPKPAGVTLTGAEIREEGIVVPGTVALAPSKPVVVRRAARAGFADALQSWIPGGTIDRFIWGSRVEEHRFVTQSPQLDNIFNCLTVQGTRVTRGGGRAPVSGDDCLVISAALPLLQDLPQPTGPAGGPLLALVGSAAPGEAELVGHYDPWASGQLPSRGPVNVLVHFADGPWQKAAAAIDEAIAAARRRDAALVVVGVTGAREAAEASEAGLREAVLLVTDDGSRGWAEALGVERGPATVLVGPDGAVAWRETQAIDVKRLASALRKNLVRGGELSWNALRNVGIPGREAPDVRLPLGEGREIPLRRLRGGAAALCFWTSSSEASIGQLRELRAALEARGDDDPIYVVGIGDGESQRAVAEVAKREQLPFPLVADPDRLIARRYAISAWPTTVQVGPDATVLANDLGVVGGLNLCV